jgi:hypothetical protein
MPPWDHIRHTRTGRLVRRQKLSNCPICAQQHIPADPVSSTPIR